ncbi:hypothetical protein HK102_003642 [Quaeritorhiza haematococci]|nr:hypothetical protein HK102_003642 [Quaeritorhiza haematococci]
MDVWAVLLLSAGIAGMLLLLICISWKLSDALSTNSNTSSKSSSFAFCLLAFATTALCHNLLALARLTLAIDGRDDTSTLLPRILCRVNAFAAEYLKSGIFVFAALMTLALASGAAKPKYTPLAAVRLNKVRFQWFREWIRWLIWGAFALPVPFSVAKVVVSPVVQVRGWICQFEAEPRKNPEISVDVAFQSVLFAVTVVGTLTSLVVVINIVLARRSRWELMSGISHAMVARLAFWAATWCCLALPYNGLAWYESIVRLQTLLQQRLHTLENAEERNVESDMASLQRASLDVYVTAIVNIIVFVCFGTMKRDLESYSDVFYQVLRLVGVHETEFGKRFAPFNAGQSTLVDDTLANGTSTPHEDFVERGES